ncbi:hypothetical protein B296_00025582 [Ensete ventricosum]|uniref:Uncharacterized protein n=1 Tax=Ensete ventricosum TaxID=4639 RepID=A0A426Y752_ENSVE|nr:hypothetical protein B296_00025582 [Ensete ventricosum]
MGKSSMAEVAPLGAMGDRWALKRREGREVARSSGREEDGLQPSVAYGSGVETMIVAGAMGKTVASDAQQDPTRGYRCCKRAASVAEVAGQR